MTVPMLLAIAAGGSAGALLRALAGRLIPTRFPFATLLVNVTGSFLFTAFLTGLPEASTILRAFLGTGICGALTTFSTFILESVLLYRSGFRRLAALYIGMTLFLCCLASWMAFISVR